MWTQRRASSRSTLLDIAQAILLLVTLVISPLTVEAQAERFRWLVGAAGK